MSEIASIIVVTYNHKKYLKSCIESIQNQDYPHEIILIDNCSTDGTAEFVRENFPFVRIIESKKNLGYGAGNNFGVKYAKGEYIVILNPDTIVEKKWLKELIKPLEKGERLITTPKILLYDGSAISACGLAIHYTGLAFVRGYLAKSYEFTKSEYVGCLSGACFANKKKDFEELEGFDENFFLYAEDSDLSWRAHLKGFKILYVPFSVIKHDAIIRVPPEKMYYLEKGRYMILRKYLSFNDFLLISPSLLIVEFLTFGYALKCGLKGIIYKYISIKDGLKTGVNKVNGDRENLFNSFKDTIPTDQLTSNKIEKMSIIFANKIFKWNFKVIR